MTDEERNRLINIAKSGIKTLDAKWLDPECWDGCKSLKFKHEVEKLQQTNQHLVKLVERLDRFISANGVLRGHRKVCDRANGYRCSCGLDELRDEIKKVKGKL